MSQHRSWTFRDVSDFCTLASYTRASLAIEESSALVRLFNRDEIEPLEKIIGPTSQLGTTKSERHKNYLDKVKANSFRNWLFKQPDFKKAHSVFKRKCQTPRNVGYQSEWAELRFLRCAAIAGFVILDKESGSQRRHPSSRQVKQAIKSTVKLQSSLTAGVRLSDYSKTLQLNQLLAELLETLKSIKRKPRADKTSIDRVFVRVISEQLHDNFGEVSPKIVTHLARVIGYTADDTAIEAQIRNARSKQKEVKRALEVDALANTHKKSA